VADKTLELRQLALLHLVERSVAFRTINRDLIARRFACRTIGRCLILHTSSSIWRFGDIGGLAVCQLSENVRDLANGQAKIDVDHVKSVLRHIRRKGLSRILDNGYAAARFNGEEAGS